MGLLIARLRARIVAAGLAAIVVFAGVAALAPSGNSLFSGFDRLNGSGSASGATTQRVDQLHESLALAWDHPLTGIGFQVIADAHNLPVQVWEAAGLLGVLALLLYSTGVFRTAWLLARDPRLPRGSPELVWALAISFAIWLVAGLLQDPIADRYIYMPVGLLLGLGLAANASRGRPDESTRPRSLPPRRPGAAAAAIPAESEPAGSERVPVAS
jgi:O-antigen ligase